MHLSLLRGFLLQHTLRQSRTAEAKLFPIASRRQHFAGKLLPAPRQAAVGHFYSTLARRSSLMVQFHRVKAQFPDHILLFQVGDFYELYENDASEAASKTSLRLTKKAGVLMAGFPVRSLDQWQRELVEAGLQLAICNQQPSRKDQSSPSLLEREVVRLITPGTLTEPLDHSSNFLLSISPGPLSALGLAWADVSTSEFVVSSVGVVNLDEELERLAPSEVLLPRDISEMVKGNLRMSLSSSAMGLSSCPMVEGLLQSSLLRECCITAVPVEWYSTNDQERGRGGQQNLSHFHQRHMESGLFSAIMSDTRFSELERSAASALLWYICHTHRHALPHLLPPSPFSHRHHLAIDASTRRALELVSPQQGNSKKSTLLGSLDRTLTAAGARLLRARLTAPLTDVTSINKRLDTVEVFHSFPLHREAVRVQLRLCADVQRALQKVATMSCSVADLRAIQTTLSTAGSILRYMSEVMRPELPASVWTVLVEETTSGLKDLPHLVLELGRAVGEPHSNRCHFISSGYSEEVDRLREKMGENENAVQRLASSLQERTGVTKLSVVAYKMYGRVLEVSRAQAVKLDRFPKLIRIDHTQSKTRYTHVDLQTMNSELHGLEAHYMETQENLFQLLCDKVMAHSEDISSTAASLARLDVATSLGLLAQERRYSRPKVVEEAVFQVEQGVHPVLASSSGPLSHHFVSNDCSLHPHRLWVLTGPNMGGKSTFLRQNSLLLIMAQMGSFVPARRAVVGVADRLFARVGAADNVTKHMSTFHVEMAETANILVTATRHSFVVLDEIGRGTSAIEGLAIAESVTQHLCNVIGCRCLVATHYHQLGQERQALLGPSVGCYQLEAELDNHGGLLRFTYKVKAGRAEHSFGIEVARLAGLPTAVIDNAKELLHNNKFVTLKG